MKDLLLITFSLWLFPYMSGGVQAISSHVAHYRTKLLWVKPQIIPVYNQLSSKKGEAVPITISLNSSQLKSGVAALVKVQIKNTTKVGLQLWEQPSDFRLAKSEADAGDTEPPEYSASARLWECSPKSSALNESGTLAPGESFECETDLSKLNWTLSKSSVYNISPIFPRGNLFYEVPSGTYKLSFGLYSPQELIDGYPTQTIYPSNEIHVDVDR